MRRLKTEAGVLAAAAFVFFGAGLAGADITTERSASIIVFPKVIANGTRDTVIQLTNTSNGLVRAHCFYVNGALADPTQEPGPLNPPLWQEIDFSLTLTRQQPTQWTVSRGRVVDPFDPTCGEEPPACQGSGIDPGLIPPVAPDFTGELKCVEVDLSGAPLSGNHLLGNATIVNVVFAPVPIYESQVAFFRGGSKYNGIGVLGGENNGDDILVLGGGQCSGSGAICSSDDDCGDAGPCVLEYNACPETWIVNHLADGAPDPVLDDTLPDAPASDVRAFVETEITIVPCTENFETQIPTTVTLQFLTTNEFESRFSTSTSITCWANFRLEDIGAPALTFDGQPPDPSGTSFLQTRIRSAAGSPFGVMMVVEETHVAKPTLFAEFPEDDRRIAVTDAANVHVEGERPVPDLITIPADQLAP